MVRNGFRPSTVRQALETLRYFETQVAFGFALSSTDSPIEGNKPKARGKPLNSQGKPKKSPMSFVIAAFG